jgi:hypothetical protein
MKPAQSSRGEAGDSKEEVVNRPDGCEKGLKIHWLGHIGIGMEVVAAEHVLSASEVVSTTTGMERSLAAPYVLPARSKLPPPPPSHPVHAAPTAAGCILVNEPPAPTLLGQDPRGHRADNAQLVDAGVGPKTATGRR